jgi:hypothetical protein
MNMLLVDTDMIKEGCSSSGIVSIWISGGEIPLVAPPEFDSSPIDVIAAGLTDGGENRCSDSAAGENDSSETHVSLPLDDT